jgi:hypothetical protein
MIDPRRSWLHALDTLPRNLDTCYFFLTHSLTPPANVPMINIWTATWQASKGNKTNSSHFPFLFLHSPVQIVFHFNYVYIKNNIYK